MRFVDPTCYERRESASLGIDLEDHHLPTTNVFLDTIVRRVMAVMAMNEPFPWLKNLPDHIVSLTRTDVDRVTQNLLIGTEHLPIDRGDLEGTAMNGYRMNISVIRADEPDASPITDAHVNRHRGRKGFSIDREIVGQRAVHWPCGKGIAFPGEPLLQIDQHVLLIVERRIDAWVLRIDDQRSVETERSLAVEVVRGELVS